MTDETASRVAVARGARAAPVRNEVSLRGRAVRDLPTPVLLLDAQALRFNVDAMATWARGVVQLRPHAKIHKCVEIALLQQDAGSIGSTAATVWEAAALIDGGIREVLIANEVTGREKLLTVARLAGKGSVIVAIDDRETAQQLAEVARSTTTTVGAVVEIDVGMGRGGVRSDDGARRVADVVASTEGLALRGVMGYEGHVVLEREHDLRRTLAQRAMAELVRQAEMLRRDGHEIEIVSAGGTNTYDMTGVIDGVTEIQAGTYALMDVSYTYYAPRFEPALSVAGRVVSRHGTRVILDCGSKAVGISELAPPRPRAQNLELKELHEEHALLDVLEPPTPQIDEVVELVVGYCGGAVNAHDAYAVVEDGTVVDVWPIVARGPGFTACR